MNVLGTFLGTGNSYLMTYVAWRVALQANAQCAITFSCVLEKLDEPTEDAGDVHPIEPICHPVSPAFIVSDE
jgi:hypothetical protein